MTYNLLYSLKGHTYSVMALQFSPNSDMLVSLGSPHDKGIMVWAIDDKVTDAETESERRRIMANSESANVNCIAFAPEMNLLITAGYSHLKFWQLNREEP